MNVYIVFDKESDFSVKHSQFLHLDQVFFRKNIPCNFLFFNYIVFLCFFERSLLGRYPVDRWQGRRSAVPPTSASRDVAYIHEHIHVVLGALPSAISRPPSKKSGKKKKHVYIYTHAISFLIYYGYVFTEQLGLHARIYHF